MEYKEHKIVATDTQSHFYSIDENGLILNELRDIKYDDTRSDEVWFSVVGRDNWVQQTFSTIDECKDYIDEEVK